jgi:sugar lactone lactonase YvrE
MHALATQSVPWSFPEFHSDEDASFHPEVPDMHGSPRILALATLILLVAGCQTDPLSTEPAGLSSTEITTLKLHTGDPSDLDGGAALHGANGLALKNDGVLYVGSLFGREIAELALADGTVAARLGPAEGVEGADDLLRAADGTLVWSNFWTGEVVRRAPDGSLDAVQVGRGVGPLARHPDGRLFAARRFLGSGLYMLSADLKSAPVLVAEPGVIGGMVFGPQRRLWYADWERGAVYRLDVDDPGALPVQAAGGFGAPSGLDFDTAGRLLVADHATGQVWRLDLGLHPHDDPLPDDPAAKLRNRELLATREPGLADLIADPRGHVFVSNGQDGAVTKLYDWGGRREICRGGMILPGGVAVRTAPDGTNPLFIADAWTLRRFDRTTGLMTGVERCVMGVNGFTPPMTVALDGQALILSSWLGAVQVWDPDVCAEVATYVYDTTQEIPLNALRFGDGLVVAGLLSGSVFYAADKTLLADGFTVPTGLACRNGDLWAADRATGEIWHIAADGAPLPARELVTSGLDEPEGLAAYGDRFLLAVETGAGRLTRIDVLTGRKVVLADELEIGLAAAPGCPPTWQFNGVTVDPDGRIYVTSDVSNRVYVITPPRGGMDPDVFVEP